MIVASTLKGKRMYFVVAILCFLLLASGRSLFFGPPGGILFANIKGPVAITSSTNTHGYNASGSSNAWTFFYLVSVGDVSFQAAKAAGANTPELVRVTHADYEWLHLLGCGRYKLTVYFYDPELEQREGTKK